MTGATGWAKAALVAVAAVGVAGRALSQAPPPATTAPATAPADRLAECIRAIRAADGPEAAMAAYARGCTLSRESAELHDAYMRRMLRFGLPQIAQYPARTLVSLDASNGLAWGTLAYMQGKRGELADALTSSLKALERITDDPSILHNAGQLLAWYEGQTERPKIPDAARRQIENLRQDLMDRPPFAKAFNQTGAVYQARAALAQQFQQKVAAAEQQAQAVQKDAEDLDRQLKGQSNQIADHRDVLGALRRDLARLEDNKDNDPLYRLHRIDLQDRIVREQQALSDLDMALRALRRQGERVLADLKQARAAVEQVRSQLQQALTKIQLDLRWDPPAVDGVVTPEAQGMPVASRPASAPADDPQALAASKLDLARLYLQHGMQERAADILREIAAQFPATKAAAEARRLLADLSAQPKP